MDSVNSPDSLNTNAGEPLERAAAGEADFSLLDMLGTLAENVKLLVVGTLIAGALGLALAFAWPATYQSVAVLQADQGTASHITTATVLGPVAEQLGLAQGTTADEAIDRLRSDVKATVGRNDKLITLTVTAGSPAMAQQTANALLAQTYVASRPKGLAKARLETLLSEASLRLESAQKAAKQVLAALEASPKAGASELPRGFGELLAASGAAQRQVAELEAVLQGVSESQIVQEASLVLKPKTPKKALLVIGITAASFIFLVLFVFVRQFIRGSASDPSIAAKWKRIRNCF